MKKLLAVLALIMFSSSVFAANKVSNVTSKLNNGLNTLSQKEQALNNKIDKAQADRAAKKAQAQKQADAQKAKVEAQKAAAKKQADANKAAAQARVDAHKANVNNTKKAIDNEKKFWSDTLKK